MPILDAGIVKLQEMGIVAKLYSEYVGSAIQDMARCYKAPFSMPTLGHRLGQGYLGRLCFNKVSWPCRYWPFRCRAAIADGANS